MERVILQLLAIFFTFFAAITYAGNRYPAECKKFKPDPEPFYAPEPRYPQRAAQRLMQGCVFVSLNIDSEGKPYNIELVGEHPPKFGFARSALKAANKLRYEKPSVENETQKTQGIIYQFQYKVAVRR